jgi:hypothetical protein
VDNASLKVDDQGVLALHNEDTSTPTGAVASVSMDDATGLRVNDARVLFRKDKVELTPANTAAAAGTPSLMLSGMEDITLNYRKASLDDADVWKLAGGVTHLKYDDVDFLKFGPIEVVTKDVSLQETGDVTSTQLTDQITITPGDPTDQASAVQQIMAAGSNISLTLDASVDLTVGTQHQMFHQRLTETGNLIIVAIPCCRYPPL